jgi:Glycosyl transferase family 2
MITTGDCDRFGNLAKSVLLTPGYAGVPAMSEPQGVIIIVVNYNNERFLAPAIDSALGQSHPLCEVIVVDYCSTDDS